MNKQIVKSIQNRTTSCELCSQEAELQAVLVEGMPEDSENSYALLCSKCTPQIAEETEYDPQHLRCLNDSMWSELDSVKVLSYRLLHQIKAETWPVELIEMMYMEEDLQKVADSTLKAATHFDSNGVGIFKGDTVTLIKDLDVKGSSLVAKRGTAVRNVSLVHDDPSHVVGKVEGQTIYIKTEFVKK